MITDLGWSIVKVSRAGHLHDRPPQVGDHLDKLRELLEIHGLRQEGVCCAYGETLLLALGHCEHHNRKLPQVRILSDAKEHVSPVQLRQIEIEEQEIRARGCLVRGLASEKRERLDTVSDRPDAVRQL